ncbi:MAG: hypothetical protein BWY92_01368 [Firmicutes bacterium ADurb.BinA052]|nr:MAG: hypothetical protein BWY92_01368 [Firmicutes bacterium ADurb.BinA052]
MRGGRRLLELVNSLGERRNVFSLELVVGVDDVESVLICKRPDVRHLCLKSVHARIERCIHCIDPRAEGPELGIVFSPERIDDGHDHIDLDGEFAAHRLKGIVNGCRHLRLGIDQVLLVHGGEFIQGASTRVSLGRQ